jgi:exodeoxyribonuclease VII large subunit
VTAVTRALKEVVEGAFGMLSVDGEVFSARKASSGHLYFTLKDAHAQLPCVMWRSAVQMLATPIEDGMKLVAAGKISVYEPHGRYQMVVRSVRQSGLGELLVQLEKLRLRLAAEGLFDAERKKPLPLLPRKVGVVTAATGAAIRDIIATIHQRYPMGIVLYPARVQGPGAAAQIARGIAALDAADDVEVIIVGRGGGSLQDLWAFNEEVVVRAIAACQTPVVSAVGHEVDTLLSDYVADVRAATPTAAGEMVVPRRVDLEHTLRGHLEDLEAALLDIIGSRQQRLDDLVFRMQVEAEKVLARGRERQGILAARLRNLHPKAQVQQGRHNWQALSRRLMVGGRGAVGEARMSLRRATEALSHLSPLASLERGYAIVRGECRSVINSAGQVNQGDSLEILLHRGAIDARVVGTEAKNEFEPEKP